LDREKETGMPNFKDNFNNAKYEAAFKALCE
jgi:hypothetical protein